jgi:Carboxypeptidase regulatory-like domain/TonB dependent receptor/TonB-dependent Receptor Plug Domain
MKTQRIEPVKSWDKRGSETSPLYRRAVRWCLLCLLPVLILGSLMAPRAFAQGAQISGVISDSSGARLAGANVTIVNQDTGISRSVDTNSDGFFAVPLLQPGKYMVTAKSTGFATQIQSGITLEVGAHEVLNFTLQVGQMTQSVEVTTEAPTVELASSALSAVVNSNTVRELPLNGRSWTDLATLQPGITLISTQPVQNENRGFGAQLAISGARPQQNNYRLDGVSLNDYSNGGPGSVLGGNLGVDAIQEFSVLTSNYPAEYGKTSGGVVNAMTRPGTNEFHGSVYEFIRNSALDARNFFDSTIPPFRRNQFGASAGGPIIKDRTFIFGDYEAIRQSLGVTSVTTVPSPAARNGNLCTIPDNPMTNTSCSPNNVTVDPSIAKILNIFPLPNLGILSGSGSNGDLGTYGVAEQQIVSENFFTFRVDHKFSDQDSIFGTYMFDNTPLTTPDNFNDVLLGSLTKRQALILEESHIFNPSLINSLRFGFNRDFANGPQTLQALNPASADPSLGPVPGYNLGTVLVPGVDKYVGGLNAQSVSLFRWNSFQGYDDVFLTRGVHALKFGVAVERDQLNELVTNSPGGEVHFDSLSHFLTDQPQLLLAALPGLLTPRGTRQTILGLYAQDDWRFRTNLTINLGIRYEMSTVPTEVQGKLSNLYNLTDSAPHLGNPYFENPTLRNFEPRVGFAWDPFHNGKTAVRGGFGVYDSLPMLYEFATVNGVAAPFFELGSTTTANPIPQGFFPAKAFSYINPSTSLAYVSIEQKPKRNYVLQWNLNIQHEITPSLTATLGYVGSKGVHNEFRSGDANIAMPTLTPAGYVYPTTGTTLNPNAGAIKYINWAGDSNYNSMEFGLTKTMSHGLTLQSSFTWSKSIDTSSSGSVEDNFVNSISSLPWFNLNLNRAVSDFNIARTLVISSSWQVPDLKSLSGPAAWIVNGWELGAIFKANDGAPFTATFGSDGDPQGLQSTDPWAFPNRVTGPGCQTLTNPGNPNNYIKTQCFAVPTAPDMTFWNNYCNPTPYKDSNGNPVAVAYPLCFNLRGNAGRNTLVGPGMANLDFSVFKNNSIKRISENFKVQFRAELFNVLNRPNFSVPNSPNNTDIFDSTGSPNGAAGILTSTSTTSRQIQFALKFTW